MLTHDQVRPQALAPNIAADRLVQPKSETRSAACAIATTYAPPDTERAVSQSDAIAPETLKKFRHGYSEHAQEPPTPTQDPLESIRLGWRDLAGETARNIQRLSQATVEQALEIGQRLWRIQRDLKKKEYTTFLSVLGWASGKARKFINLAKTFAGFKPSQLIGIEITTLLSLCQSRYSTLVEQLREVEDITQQFVEQLIKETKKPRKPKQDPISGWKQNRSGGARRYEVILHDESTGLSIEQQAEAEAILPHKVIEEAVALRLKSKTDQEGDSAIEVLQVLEQPDEQERINAIREQIEAEAQQQARNHFEICEFALKREIADLKAQLFQSATNSLGLVEKTPATTLLQETQASEPIEELPATTIPPSNEQREAIENPTASTAREAAVALKAMETPATATITQEDEALEPVESATYVQLFSDEKDALASENLDEDIEAQIAEFAPVHHLFHSGSPTETDDDYLEPVAEPNPQQSDDASTASKQPLMADWDLLQQLRAAEGYIQKIDTQIKDFTSKLASPGLDRAVERELKGLLANRQKLRTTKIFQIVSFADSNSIPVNYGQLRDQGRVVLVPEYASALLRQAKSWADVVLVSGSDHAQLINAIKDWTKESRQLLVHLLSAYLESEPSALGQIDWIPEKLIAKALSLLAFKIRKIGGPNNLVDEPKIEYISCDFVSLEQTGTDRERWIFRDSNNKNHAVFGRDEIEVEGF